jgi:hypothetical protein
MSVHCCSLQMNTRFELNALMMMLLLVNLVVV